MANRDSTRTLDKETIIMVRDALLIGLASYGQVEQALANQKGQEQLGKPIPENQQVKHPTGMADTVSRFAEALWAMYWILWEETTASNSSPCVEKHRLKCYPYMVRVTGLEPARTTEIPQLPRLVRLPFPAHQQ